jgi:hypothetical protein
MTLAECLFTLVNSAFASVASLDFGVLEVPVIYFTPRNS